MGNGPNILSSVGNRIEIAILWMKERLRFANICIKRLVGRLRPKHPLLIQKHFLFILKTQVKIKSEVLVCGRARMWVGVRDHNLFIMDAQSPEVAAMGNHICFLPCLPCMEALDSKVHFFFQQFRHTFCPYQHRHKKGYVSEFQASAFLGNCFL